MRSTRNRLGITGSILVTLILIAPAASFAQKRANTSIGTTGTSRRERVISREAETQGREARLRSLSEGGRVRAPRASTHNQRLIVSQIFEDFEQIQLVNREMMVASATLDATTCKQIAKLAEDMNKRARRLKSNLGVADLEGEKKESGKAPAMDEAQFKAALQSLNASVMSFVGNPLFQDPRVTDVRQLDNLRADITNVIDLSRTIKKVAPKLH